MNLLDKSKFVRMMEMNYKDEPVWIERSGRVCQYLCG